MTAPQLTNLIADYLDGHRPPLAKNSLASYGGCLRNFSKANHFVKATEITFEAVDGWVYTAGIARRSQAHRRAVLNGFCEWLCYRGDLRSNPVTQVARPKLPRTRPRALSPSAASAVMRSALRAGTEDALIVSLMLNEGLRSMEVRELEIGDIDLERGSLYIHGKGEVERTLPLTGQTRGFLEQHLRRSGFRAGLVTLTPGTRRPMSASGIHKRIVALFVEAGVKLAPNDGMSAHALRHTCASDVYEASGYNPRVVQELLGHQSLTTTQVYLRPVSPDEMVEAMDGRRY